MRFKAIFKAFETLKSKTMYLDRKEHSVEVVVMMRPRLDGMGDIFNLRYDLMDVKADKKGNPVLIYELNQIKPQNG